MKISIYKKGQQSPKFIFREKAYWDILSMMCSEFAKTKEFMFYGLIEKRVGNIFIVERFDLIPNKKNSAAYCESDEERYLEYFQKIYTKDELRRVRIHAHSHVNMGTSPSGTDNTEFSEKANNISDYYIQLIVNHKEEHTVNICDALSGIKFENVPQYINIGNYIYSFEDKAIYDWDEEKCEIKDKVKITDGTYIVEDNAIQFSDNLYFDFDDQCFVLDGNYLYKSCKNPTFKYMNKEQKEEVEKQFTDLIKVEKPINKNNNSKKSTSNTNTKDYSKNPFYYNYSYYGDDDFIPGASLLDDDELSEEEQAKQDAEVDRYIDELYSNYKKYR